MITPLKRVSAKEAVIYSIEKYIISNNLETGMSLPSEHKLSESMGVSRNILREGLEYFKALGIIGTKPKTGAYIKDLSPTNPFNAYMGFIRNNKEKIKQIAQLRMIMELGAISLLIKLASKEDLKILEDIANKMKNADSTKLQKLDIDFHTYILTIVKNDFMKSMIPLIIDFFAECTKKKKTSKVVSEEHLSIVKAIKEKDYLGIQKLVQSHYQSYLPI